MPTCTSAMRCGVVPVSFFVVNAATAYSAAAPSAISTPRAGDASPAPPPARPCTMRTTPAKASPSQASCRAPTFSPRSSAPRATSMNGCV